MALLGSPWRLLRWMVRTEIGIWRSLYFWTRRRVPGKPEGASAFPYAREVTPLLLAFVFTSIIELPVVHFLIPWETIRLIVLVLSLWSLLWMVGLFASYRIYQHVIDDEGLLLRQGAHTKLRIRSEDVASVKASRGRARKDGVRVTDDGAMTLALLKMTRVDIELREPVVVEHSGHEQPVTRVSVFADDPGAFVRAARARLPVPAG